MHVRRAALRAAVAIATALTGTAVPAGSAATAVPGRSTTFTWTGASEQAYGDARMSTPGNWSAGLAPPSGTPVDLVFPALSCVVAETCDRVRNDIPGLQAASFTVTAPGTPPPGPYVKGGVYHFNGTELRLSGSLVTAVDRATGPQVPSLLWRMPVRVDGGGAAWLLADVGMLLRGRVTGGPLQVRPTGGAALVVAPAGSIEVARLEVSGTHANVVSSVYGADVDARTRGPVTFRSLAVSLAHASLGPVTVRSSDLEITSASKRKQTVTRVAGDLRLDGRSHLALREFGHHHASLVASGAVRLGGAELDAYVECSDARVGTASTYLRAASVTGHLSRTDGTPIRDGDLVSAVGLYSCDHDPRVRVDYTPQALTLTVVGVG